MWPASSPGPTRFFGRRLETKLYDLRDHAVHACMLITVQSLLNDTNRQQWHVQHTWKVFSTSITVLSIWGLGRQPRELSRWLPLLALSQRLYLVHVHEGFTMDQTTTLNAVAWKCLPWQLADGALPNRCLFKIHIIPLLVALLTRFLTHIPQMVGISYFFPTHLDINWRQWETALQASHGLYG